MGVTIINHQVGNGWDQLSMVIWGMVYYCYTHTTKLLNNQCEATSRFWGSLLPGTCETHRSALKNHHVGGVNRSQNVISFRGWSSYIRGLNIEHLWNHPSKTSRTLSKSEHKEVNRPQISPDLSNNSANCFSFFSAAVGPDSNQVGTVYFWRLPSSKLT